MNNYTKLYWLTRLDNFNNVFIGLMILSAIVLFVWYMIRMMQCCDNKEIDNYNNRYKSIRIVGLTIFTLGILVQLFLPTKKEMIIIYAGGATMDYINKDTSLSKIPYQTTTLISNYLDKTIKELK